MRTTAPPVDVHRAGLRILDEMGSWEGERVVQDDGRIPVGDQRYDIIDLPRSIVITCL